MRAQRGEKKRGENDGPLEMLRSHPVNALRRRGSPVLDGGRISVFGIDLARSLRRKQSSQNHTKIVPHRAPHERAIWACLFRNDFVSDGP